MVAVLLQSMVRGWCPNIAVARSDLVPLGASWQRLGVFDIRHAHTIVVVIVVVVVACHCWRDAEPADWLCADEPGQCSGGRQAVCVCSGLRDVLHHDGTAADQSVCGGHALEACVRSTGQTKPHYCGLQYQVNGRIGNYMQWTRHSWNLHGN